MNLRAEGKVNRVKNYAFRLDDLIGKGATGKVYKGINEHNGQQVAIKIIQMSKIDNQVTQYLLACEKDALISISNPYVLTAYDILQTQEDCLIVTPLCSGGTLKEYISSKGKLPQQEALHIFVKLLRGYLQIRNKGFIHRDIKSSNVMFRNGQPLIIDFGYCEKMGSKKPKMFYNVGSPSYMSPEAYFKTFYSQKSDLWSLGIVLYQMLQGFTIDHGQPIDRYFSILLKHGFAMRSKVSENVKNLLKWILNPNFHQRPSVQPLIQSTQRIIYSGNQNINSQSTKNRNIGDQSKTQKQEPIRISLKQSQKRVQQIFQQKLIQSRDRYHQNQPHLQKVPTQNIPNLISENQHQYQHQAQQYNQRLLPPTKQILQLQQMSPVRSGQNKGQNELFDRNLIKLSQSVYRAEGQIQNNIINAQQKNKIIHENPHISPSFQYSNKQIPINNRPQSQGQYIQRPMPINQPVNTMIQIPQFAPQSLQMPQQFVYQIPPQQHQLSSQHIPLHNQQKQLQNSGIFLPNQQKLTPQYRSMINSQNTNESNGKLTILENGRNFKVCHSKIFNAESVLSLQSNHAAQQLNHLQNIPMVNSIHHKILSNPNSNVVETNKQQSNFHPVVQSLIIEPQRSLDNSFQNRNQVFRSFIVEEQRQPAMMPPSLHMEFKTLEQNGRHSYQQGPPFISERIKTQNRQPVFVPNENRHIQGILNNRPFSPVASEKQIFRPKQAFQTQRIGTQRNFVKKAEPYFHMTNQIPAQHILNRQTLPNNWQRPVHNLQGNFRIPQQQQLHQLRR